MTHEEKNPVLPMEEQPAPGEPLNPVSEAVQKAQVQADTEALQQARE
jgi:hypothetical protein